MIHQLTTPDCPYQQAAVEIGLVRHPPQDVLIHRRRLGCSPFRLIPISTPTPTSSASTNISRTAFRVVAPTPPVIIALLSPGRRNRTFIDAVFSTGDAKVNTWAAVSYLFCVTICRRIYPGRCRWWRWRRRRGGEAAEIEEPVNVDHTAFIAASGFCRLLVRRVGRRRNSRSRSRRDNPGRYGGVDLASLFVRKSGLCFVQDSGSALSFVRIVFWLSIVHTLITAS